MANNHIADDRKKVRLIDANAFRNSINGWKLGKIPKGELLWDLDRQPTVDAVEVVHGRWLYDSGSGKYFCSACDEYALSFRKDTLFGGDLYEVCLTDYCPNCGAKMDGERKDNG